MTRTGLMRRASRIATMTAALIVAGLAQPTMLRAQGSGDLSDLYVLHITGPGALQTGLSGTYEVQIGLAVGKSGITPVPLELHIVFAGTLDQTDRVVADAGLECQVGHDVGINAVVRCTGQIKGLMTVVVQGRGRGPGVGKLVVTVNASRSVAEDMYTNNLLQKDIDILPAQGNVPPPPGLPPATASGACGPPGGTATVVISDPKLNKLNVRASAGGKVLGTIPAGSQVSIVGECGSEQAAGIVAKPQQPTTGSDWCQIDAPVTGCVSAKFLAFGGTGAAGVAAGLAKPPADQIAAPVAAANFAGTWDSLVDGVAHYITLRQEGNSVTGEYSAEDGSAGNIAGTASGKVLRFAWSQADGIAGSGKFTLSGDGQSFHGSYNFGDDPNEVEGNWNGNRQ